MAVSNQTTCEVTSPDLVKSLHDPATLYSVRLALGMTQAEVAALAGISPAMVGNVELGFKHFGRIR
jgi:hypothetical protein